MCGKSKTKQIERFLRMIHVFRIPYNYYRNAKFGRLGLHGYGGGTGSRSMDKPAT